MTQFNYAGLDARAGVLLFYHVHQRMDPIFTEPRPDVAALSADTTLRLYTATNTRYVAKGDPCGLWGAYVGGREARGRTQGGESFTHGGAADEEARPRHDGATPPRG